MSRVIAPVLRNGFPFAIPTRAACYKYQADEIGNASTATIPSTELADPDDNKYAIWDGATYYEFSSEVTVPAYPGSADTETRGFHIKCASNSADYITPLVGDGTKYFRIPLSDAAEIYWRYRRIGISGDAKFSMDGGFDVNKGWVETTGLGVDGVTPDADPPETRLLLEQWNAWQEPPPEGYWDLDWNAAPADFFELPTPSPLITQDAAVPVLRYGVTLTEDYESFAEYGVGSHGELGETLYVKQVEVAPSSSAPRFVAVDGDGGYVYLDAASILNVQAYAALRIGGYDPGHVRAKIAERETEFYNYVFYNSDYPYFSFIKFGSTKSIIDLSVGGETAPIPVDSYYLAEGFESNFWETLEQAMETVDTGTVTGGITLSPESYWPYDGLWDEGTGEWLGGTIIS